MESVAISTNLTENIHVWNVETGVLLHSWKGNKSFGACLLNHPSSRSSALLAPQSGKPLIQGYYPNKTPSAFKYIVAEEIFILAASHSGAYIAGGGMSGRVYLWHYETGILVRMWDAHYKKVTGLTWTIDDDLLYSASEDTQLHSWSMVQLLHTLNSSVSPLVSFSGHSLAITGLVVSKVLSADARIITCSLDKSCKVWDPKGMCLATISFPRSISCISIDTALVYLFAGSLDGTIFRTNLYASNEPSVLLEKHTDTITSLSFSLDEALLISSSLDGTCIVWDPSTRADLRTFNQSKGPVTSCLITSWDENRSSLLSNASFQRFPSSHSEQQERMTTILSKTSRKILKFTQKEIDGLLGKDPQDSTKEELALLRAQNQELRRLNDELYKSVL